MNDPVQTVFSQNGRNKWSGRDSSQNIPNGKRILPLHYDEGPALIFMRHGRAPINRNTPWLIFTRWAFSGTSIFISAHPPSVGYRQRQRDLINIHELTRQRQSGLINIHELILRHSRSWNLANGKNFSSQKLFFITFYFSPLNINIGLLKLILKGKKKLQAKRLSLQLYCLDFGWTDPYKEK